MQDIMDHKETGEERIGKINTEEKKWKCEFLSLFSKGLCGFVHTYLHSPKETYTDDSTTAPSPPIP